MSEKIWFKFGSTSVADHNGLREDYLDKAARQLAIEHRRGRLGGIVTSGAVLLGRSIDPSEKDDQVAASMGSAGVVVGWGKALGKYGIMVGQVLTTHQEMDDPEEGGMLQSALAKMNTAGKVPIVNQNDLESEEELDKRPFGGDNDKLSGHIVRLTGSDGLYIATAGVRGLLRCDGKYRVRTVAAEADHSQGVYSYDEALEFAGYVEGAPENSMSSKTKVLVDLARDGIAGYIGPADAPFQSVWAGHTGTEFRPQITQ